MAGTSVVSFDLNRMPARVKARGELSETAKALMGSGGFGGKRISIKGGVFRLLVAGKEVASIEERYLDVVIIKAAPKISRTFYVDQFDENNPTPPDCWSADGEKPDASIKTPQCDTCVNCPQNVKGSGKDDSKACRYSQRLALLLANDLEGDVLQLNTPAASIFGKDEGDNRPLQAYARYLAANNISPEEVVTRMRFDTKAANPKLFFKPERWLTDEEFAVATKQAASSDAQQAITFTVAQQDGVKPKEDAARAAAAIAGKRPEKVVNPEDAPPAKAKVKKEEPAEPTVRKETAQPPAAAQKKDLKALAEAWDSDD